MPEPITAIIVDDEPDAIDYLNYYLGEIKNIEVVATAENVDAGVEAIIEHKPDIVFLDIDMPGKNGFELVEDINELKLGTIVIFTTGYSEYAVDAFEKAAFGYLMKPIDKDKLHKLINRYRAEKLKEIHPGVKHKFSTFKGFVWIAEEEIMGCKADGNYTDIILTNGKTENVVMQIGKVQAALKGNNFMRIHRSSIINLNYLHAFERKTNTVVLMCKEVAHSFKVSRENIAGLADILEK